MLCYLRASAYYLINIDFSVAISEFSRHHFQSRKNELFGVDPEITLHQIRRKPGN